MGLSKTVKMSLLGLSLSIFVSSTGFAGSLRGDAQDVFSAPAAGGWMQILLGLVELGVAERVWPGMTAEQRSLQGAQERLADTESLPTSEAQKKALVEEIMVNSSNYEGLEATGQDADLKSEARVKLARVKAYDIVDAAEKAKRLASAQGEVAAATEHALKVAQSHGFIHQGIKIVRAGTSIILVGDVLARMYVWNVLDANPTFSPIASLTIQGVQNVLGN